MLGDLGRGSTQPRSQTSAPAGPCRRRSPPKPGAITTLQDAVRRASHRPTMPVATELPILWLAGDGDPLDPLANVTAIPNQQPKPASSSFPPVDSAWRSPR